jgi:hypothetical protein
MRLPMPKPGKADFAKSSESEEAYTPREWYERVIKVMGAIDTDPSADNGKRIPARVHYIKQDNGLTKPWEGRVYNNPPFGPGVKKWFEKLRLEVDEGRCTEAIILWKAALETEATRILIRNPAYRLSAVPNNRISFLKGVEFGDDFPDKRGAGDVATFTPIFHYFGPNETAFKRVFSPVCTLWKPVPPEVLQATLA